LLAWSVRPPSPFTALPPPRIYSLSLHDALPILLAWSQAWRSSWVQSCSPSGTPSWHSSSSFAAKLSTAMALATLPARAPPIPSRSEEHTSELQSRFDLVCRLLREKKKYPAEIHV